MPNLEWTTKPAAFAAVVWGEGLKGRFGVGRMVSTQAKSPRQRIALELLRRTARQSSSEDFLERPGEPVARLLRAFLGLLTKVLALISRLRAYSLRLFGGHFRTLDGRVLHISSLVTDLGA